ncbi:MAG: SEC10/PgrA surface exclusion domain-containing protein [Lactobacillus panisapium]|nr:SEC10/PgrA surface exclusion domain-containing protein [Lactobacillus panisapium]MCT6853683.1 SEC10/PgrA surface exclusion domain-containing protein [Lactobacillus panisapium]
MKKSKLAIAIINVIFLTTIPALVLHEPTPVSAATVKGFVKTKKNKKVRLYKLSGKHSNYYASPKYQYPYSSKKKIGKKKLTAYKIGNNSHWLLAKDAKVIKTIKPNVNVQATMKLPAGYTRAELLQAYQGNPSKEFIDASMSGMDTNDFSRIKNGETKADDQTIVDLSQLTPEQTDTLTTFSLRLINQARNDLGLDPWRDSIGARKLAQDIATEYAVNNKTIRDSHYVPGIVRACKANGLDLNDNYVEDMAGFYNQNNTMTMTELKKSVYFGLKQMIFGYTGSGEQGRKQPSNYQEWEHAGDLFNTQGSLHDGDYNYYGFSISHTDDICSMHFISVPTYIAKNKKYNTGFKP